MPVNPVAPYAPSNYTTQTGTQYKNTIDNNSVAAMRIVGRFAPQAQTSANMTIKLAAGSLFDGTTLTEVAAQNTGTISAPASHPRIDRVVIDNVTGAVSTVTGAEAVSPVPPTIPSGKTPIAQIALTTSTTAISNAMISDERDFSALSHGGFTAQASLASASTCDLGTILSHNVLITGTTTITSFGSSANVQSPVFLIEFAAALTLSNSASLSLPGSADIHTQAGDTAIAEYLGSSHWRVRQFTAASASLSSVQSSGYITGLTISNDTSSPTNFIDIAPGYALDSTHAHQITLASTITKQLDAAWVAGSGNGGLDTGSVTNGTYHVFLIRKDSDGSADALFSASTSPTLPSGYSTARRVGSILRLSGAIVPFIQVGNFFQLLSAVLDVSTTTLATGGTLFTISVPTGIRVMAKLRASAVFSGAGAVMVRVYCPDEMSNTGLTALNVPLPNIGVTVSGAGASSAQIQSDLLILTNTSGQIGALSTGGSTRFYCANSGWFDLSL